MTGSVEDLLPRLSSGDVAAAEETFRLFEPFLRKVVRRKFPPGMRARFDSEDIVQSVWGTLFQGFRQAGWRFTDVDHLRAFLITAARNRLVDRIRQHGRTIDREQPLADLEPEQMPAARDPRPSQVAQREELWQRILAFCPADHQEIVRLKLAGFSLGEIAEQTGLHRDSIRRILRALAGQFAFGPAAAGSSSDGEN